MLPVVRPVDAPKAPPPRAPLAGVSDEVEDARLKSLGIQIITDREDFKVHAECIRVARRLRNSRRRIVGMVPAAAHVAVAPLAIQLGMALAELTGATIGIVDANVRWPAFSALAAEEQRGPEDLIFATRWLRGSLALLTPPRAADPGAGVPQLDRVIRYGSDLFAHVLIDLTGFDLLGDHLAAFDHCDALIGVGRAGKTREDDLLRLQRDLPVLKYLGVLLVG